MNFLTWVYKVSNTMRVMGKHQASKKGYKHQHNLSKGQKNHQEFVENK